MYTEQTRTFATRILENNKRVADFAFAQQKAAFELAHDLTTASVDIWLPKKDASAKA